jgi:hypothetical protein
MKVTPTQAKEVLDRMQRGLASLREESVRLGLRSVFPLRAALVRLTGPERVKRLVRRAMRAEKERKRAAKVVATVTGPSAGVTHEDPSIGPVRAVPVGESRVVLLQRIDRVVSIRTARKEPRTNHPAFQTVGVVLVPVQAVAEVAAALRQVARQGRRAGQGAGANRQRGRGGE